MRTISKFWPGSSPKLTAFAAAALLALAWLPPLVCAQAPNAEPAARQSGRLAPGSLWSAQNFLIEPGDLLDVEVFNTPELSAKLRVDELGRVTLPVGGTVEVKGMTAQQAAAAIANQLRTADILLTPNVTVDVTEFGTEGVTVVGEVHNPGTYPLLGSRSLYAALAAAGGTNPDMGSTITISRPLQADHPIIVDVNTPNYSALEQQTMVQPGDTVVVSRAPVVYIVGDVTHSGAFPIQSGQHLRILDVVSLAQGATRTAAVTHASIVRPTPEGGAQSIPVNLNKVMKNQEPNLAMQAGDILVVPRSGVKDFGYLVLPGLTNAVVSASVSAAIIR